MRVVARLFLLFLLLNVNILSPLLFSSSSHIVSPTSSRVISERTISKFMQFSIHKGESTTFWNIRDYSFNSSTYPPCLRLQFSNEGSELESLSIQVIFGPNNWSRVFSPRSSLFTQNYDFSCFTEIFLPLSPLPPIGIRDFLFINLTLRYSSLLSDVDAEFSIHDLSLLQVIHLSPNEFLFFPSSYEFYLTPTMVTQYFFKLSLTFLVFLNCSSSNRLSFTMSFDTTLPISSFGLPDLVTHSKYISNKSFGFTVITSNNFTEFQLVLTPKHFSEGFYSFSPINFSVSIYSENFLDERGLYPSLPSSFGFVANLLFIALFGIPLIGLYHDSIYKRRRKIV
ncbi:MAG: hypothetical protein ACTSR2_06515 [Candidatus Hodarchaeales archaeon]